jgi:uncharacterized protein YukE
MASRVNLTPQELQTIINTVDKMRRKITDSAETLKQETQSINNVWKDDAFEQFEDKVIYYYDQLNNIAEQLKKEKERIEEYKDDTQQSSDKFRR